MLLKQKLARDGEFLFRWRSYLPLLLLPVLVMAMPESVQVERALGDTWSAIWTVLCVGVAFSGIAIRVATVGFVPFGTSGRNTQEQRADYLNTTGLYSIVRNPLYLGNFMGLIGLVAAQRVWWLAIIATLAYWLYIERIVAAEEAFLERKYGGRFVGWASKTPAFLPRFRNWRSSELPFSLRTVLRREYNGLAALGIAFFALSAAKDLVVEGMPMNIWICDDAGFIALSSTSLLGFVVLRSLKKHTRLLHEPGR